MLPTEAMFWAEIEAPRATSRSVKLAYAWLIATANTAEVDFGPINHAVMKRFNLNIHSLNAWKAEAWQIFHDVMDKMSEDAAQ